MGNACWPISVEEVGRVASSFTGKYKLRNRAIFVLGCCTGYRISEILSLTRCDLISEQGQIVERVVVQARNMKRKKESRFIYLADEARAALAAWLQEQQSKMSLVHKDIPAFTQENGKRISRLTAWRVLKAAYRAAGLNTNGLACHTMRKTFAEQCCKWYEDRHIPDPTRHVQNVLRHKSPETTVKYLRFRDDSREIVNQLGYKL